MFHHQLFIVGDCVVDSNLHAFRTLHTFHMHGRCVLEDIGSDLCADIWHDVHPSTVEYEADGSRRTIIDPNDPDGVMTLTKPLRKRTAADDLKPHLDERLAPATKKVKNEAGDEVEVPNDDHTILRENDPRFLPEEEDFEEEYKEEHRDDEDFKRTAVRLTASEL